MIEPQPLDIREQIIRIDHMIVDMQRIAADRDRKRQEIRLAPWALILAGAAATAALIGATAAVTALILKGGASLSGG